jgi:FKBP-type peptidyl-prolyl cis-trans isomerase FkpA
MTLRNVGLWILVCAGLVASPALVGAQECLQCNEALFCKRLFPCVQPFSCDTGFCDNAPCFRPCRQYVEFACFIPGYGYYWGMCLTTCGEYHGCFEGRSGRVSGEEDPTNTANSPVAEDPAGPTGTIETEELVVGTGAVAARVNTMTVHYIGRLQSGTVLDETYTQNRPFSFRIGADQAIRSTCQAIPGFEQGVVGMRVGGKRRITIPPDLAYGSRGLPPAIPPNATLIVEVELRGVQ